MNARLKQLAAGRGISMAALERMCALVGDDNLVEQTLKDAGFMDKMGDAMGIAWQSADRQRQVIRFKADAPDVGELDQLDQVYVVVRNTIDSGDQAQLDQALGEFAQTAGEMLGGAAPAMTDKSKPATKAISPVTLEALVKGYSWDGR